MKEIVQKWLHDCLGVSTKIENLGNEMKDGVILAKLLKHYEVVNEKAIKHIVPTNHPLTCENNLRQLNIWFQLLRIKVNNDMYFDMANGKTTTFLQILYELYLSLHNKEILHFINTKKHLTYMKKSLKISSVFLNKSSSSSYQRLIEKQLSLSCDAIDTERTSKLYTYTKKRSETSKRKMKEGSSKIKCQKGFSKKETLEKEKMKIEDIMFVRDKLDFSPFQHSGGDKDKNVLSIDIQSSTEEKKQRNKLLSRINDSIKTTTKECENLIMNSVWKAIENKDKERLKKKISHNLLHQSQYEKQMASKTFQKNLQEKMNHEKFLETKQKIEEESKNLIFFSSCKTSEEEINNQLEAITNIEIHRKLYAEKLKRRYRKHHAICFQIANDIIDLAIKKSHFGKENITDEVWSQWKQMFINEQQILELIENEDIKNAKLSVINMDVTQYSEDHALDDYLHLVGDWIEHAGIETTFDEEDVLGNIVHRLFDIKYPPSFIEKPAQLQKYKICTVMNGIADESDIIKLKILLIKSKISLVDIKSAINYCITCYKSEANIQEVTPSTKGGKKTATAGKASKREDSKKAKKASGKTENLKEDKAVQTTSSLLSTHEVKELSSAAKMGNYLYDLGNLDDIPIPTIIEVLVEFLKDQTNINGWVLVNFPSTLQEAYILEKTLSGKKFPKKFKQKLSTTKSKDPLELQHNGNLIKNHDMYVTKKSRIVQFPPNEFNHFKTYLTSFILVTNSNAKLVHESTSKNEADSAVNGNSEMATAMTDTETSEKDEISSLISIYEGENILQKFFYETMDLETIKKLARLIVKDLNSVQEIPSIELFGEEILQCLAKMTDPKNKKSPHKSKEDPAATYELLKQNLLIDEKDNESEIEIDNKMQQLSESNMMLQPGLKDWQYTDFYIPDDMAIGLATSWEEMEDIYIKKIKEILKENRNTDNLISLYTNYVTQEMSEDDDDYNESQNLVTKFVNYFNCIRKRKCSETKTQEELSSGAFHLEMKLWEITNDRKNKAEEKRKNLINQDWTGGKMIQISNKYISFLQTEADRCISTILILCNYYCLMSGSEATDFLQNLSLPKITLKNEWQEKENIKSTILQMLTDESKINLSNPLYNILNDIFKEFRTEINKLKFYLTTAIVNHEEAIFNKIKEHKENVKAENKKEKLKKLENNEDAPLLAKAKYIDIKNMFLEWSYAVKNECDRTNCRMEIIMRKTRKDAEQIENRMATLFHSFKKETTLNYLKQNESIDKICKIVHAAINENKPVLCDIIFSKNYVYTEPYQLTDLPIKPVLIKLEEELDSQCFTIKQLKYISERMKIISPNGKINKKAFIYIMQDLLFCEQEKENIQIFPKIWNEMNSVEFEKLFTTVFGQSELVNWKNFIVYSLELRFPEMEDIVNYKIHFSGYDTENQEIISYNDFMDIKLWFEDSAENVQNQATKQLLFSLFQINETEINFTDLILTFCKDFNQKIGFGKGLAYFLGKCVIVSEKELYLEDTLREHNEQQNNMVREILNQIIFHVVNTHDGLTIEEINEDVNGTANQRELDENNKNEKSLKTSEHEINRPSIKKEIESLPLNRRNETQIQDGKELELKNILNKDVQITSQASITKTDHSKSADKASQTVSLNQLLYDEYIKINKVLQWTSEVPKSTIDSLLETSVYPQLYSQIYEKEIDDIVWKMKRTLAVVKDEFIYLPWLMDQNIMQDIFSYIHSFKIFSFPSIIKGKREHPCT